MPLPAPAARVMLDSERPNADPSTATALHGLGTFTAIIAPTHYYAAFHAILLRVAIRFADVGWVSYLRAFEPFASPSVP